MTDELIAKYGDNVCSQIIEVVIRNTTGLYTLPDDAILREKKILGVFTVMNPNNNRKTPQTGNSIVSDAALYNSYLTLVDTNKRLIESHPMIDIAITISDRSHRKIQINDLTPSKSYIQVSDTTMITVGQSFLLHFIYLNN